MKSLLKKRSLLLVAAVVVLALIIGMLILSPRFGSAPLGMREVKSYNPNGTCLSVNAPECANCPGKLIDDKCFVNTGEFEQYP